jgi:hypothetical protein
MQNQDPISDLQLVASAAALAPLPYAQHQQVSQAIGRLAKALQPAPAPAPHPEVSNGG